MYTKYTNLSANHVDNENDQDNENHPDNKKEGNYPGNKYMFKVNNRKKVVVSLWLACSRVFNINFEHVIVHYYKYQRFMFYMN